MAEQTLQPGTASPIDDREQDEKEELASQFARGAEIVQDDPTRSTLHTGHDYTGEGVERVSPEGAPVISEAEPVQNAEHGAGPDTDPQAVQDASQMMPSTRSGADTSGAPSGPQPREAAEIEMVQGTSAQASTTTAALNPPQATEDGSAPPASDIEVPAAMAPAENSAEDAPNQAPDQIELSNATIAENASGAVIGSLQAVDADQTDGFEFTVSDDRFEIVNGDLRLKPGISLDHEEASTIDLDVTVTDAAGATLTQAFTINVADVNETPISVTLSNGAVAANADGAVVGALDVVDPDLGDQHVFQVSDDRFDVVDGTLRLKSGAQLDPAEGDTLDVQVTAIDTGGESVTAVFSIDVVDVPQAEVSTGFHARYFDVDHTIRRLDDIDWSQDPSHQELTQDINYKNGHGSFWEDGAIDTFGAQITGHVEVEEGGTFNFFLGGDDGVILLINGEEVVVDDGEHGYRTRNGEIELDPGTHHIELRYFENYGRAGLKLEWEGPGIDGRELVTAPEMPEAQTVSGMPLSLSAALDGAPLPDGSSLTLMNLPAGTLVSAGDDVATIPDSGSVDVTGWDTSLLNITPPVDFIGMVSAELTMTVPVEGGDVAVSTLAIPFEVNEATITPPMAELSAGFHASYFDVDHSLRALDDIDWDSSPTHEESVKEINYENSSGAFWEGGAKDTFGAKLTGQFSVEEGGSYTFFAGADDGVLVLINGEVVVDNDGLHGYRTRQGEIELEPGTYDVEVRYFENYGHAGLKLEWEGPDTDGREFVRPDPISGIEENGTLNVFVDFDGTDSAQLQMTGLPSDTIVISGDMSVVSDGSPIDLSEFNLNTLEISPPPGFEGLIEGEILATDQAFNGSEVTSTSSFSFVVGDAENAQDSAKDDYAQASEMEQSEASAQSAGWDSDADPEESDQETEDDVMSEPVYKSGSCDGMEVCVEHHDRPDW
ncbi:PA14 domain-containing protein [Gymnodinialimonas sp. 2305UL16-5]|uniref:PA14 domain-containing protein n=1 Tax=Gymnodinialimonas mytili TaxID=3126503 RepID=UPI00309E1C8E